MNAIYGKIRELRLSRKIRADQAASEIGISYHCYMLYEREEHIPSVKLLKRIAKYYGVSMSYLLGHEEQPPTEPNADLAFYETFLTMSEEEKKSLFDRVIEREKQYEAERSHAAKKKMRGVWENEYLKISPIKERLESGKCCLRYRNQ